MPLDPQIAAFLAMLAEADEKPMWEQTVQEARDGLVALTVGTLTPEQVVPVASTEDTTVPGAAGDLRARIYRPEGDGPFPTVAFFHGGGWVIGDLETHDQMAREICRDSEAVVVSVDYRLAPEHPFPAAAQDAVAAARWIAARTEEFGGTRSFGVAGDSAGGNLSAVVAQQLHADGVRIAAQFLIYPSVDPSGTYPSRVENAEGYFLELRSMEWFFAHYVQEPMDLKDPLLAPLHAADLSGLAPAVVVTAEFDPLRDEGDAYAEALRSAGVHVELERCAGMIHGFFDMGRWSPAAQRAAEESSARFGALLRG